MNDLCIGGGGYLGISFIGALEYLNENNLSDIKRFYGTSIGSLIGIYYVSGMLPKKILSILMQFNFQELINYNFSNIIETSSVFNNDILKNFMSYIEDIDTITINEFSIKYSVDINIYATNINSHKLTNFNNSETPDIALKDALMASMSIPFIFPPVKINNDYYIDGCANNALGSPPEDVFILGYSIILSPTSTTYVENVLASMIGISLPNSLYTIYCDTSTFTSSTAKFFLNYNDSNSEQFIELYKLGINSARKCIGEHVNNIKTLE